MDELLNIGLESLDLVPGTLPYSSMAAGATSAADVSLSGFWREFDSSATGRILLNNLIPKMMGTQQYQGVIYPSGQIANQAVAAQNRSNVMLLLIGVAVVALLMGRDK